MTTPTRLHELVASGASRTPEALAVTGSDGSITYGELDRLANRFARSLTSLGVRRGDRVGLWLDKSIAAVAAMQGALRIGAAYVPLDPLSPASRIRTIVDDCGMRALVAPAARLDAVLEGRTDVGRLVVADDRSIDPAASDDPVPSPEIGANELAYILYTSGSTGTPKGVCISHRNALAFVEWAAVELNVTPADRLSNHAPFHFDLSVLDLYAAFWGGAAVFLIGDGMSYVPERLVDLIVREQLTIWYSVPSALILMMDRGGLLDVASIPLRAILFAGEPFPLKHLRRLHQRWPGPRLLNLYGPTETNVCTFYEVKAIEDDRTKPVPIGKACSGDTVWAVKGDGTTAGVGEEGELLVTGPTVLLGYWGQPAHGDRPYATGDIVRLEANGNYDYIGRRDHMVKVRGHRVELGDVEAAVQTHPFVREVAVTIVGSGMEARLKAYVVGDSPPSLLELKRHCAERLPRYMIVDQVAVVASLPRTRNGKVDRLKLQELRG